MTRSYFAWSRILDPSCAIVAYNALQSPEKRSIGSKGWKTDLAYMRFQPVAWKSAKYVFAPLMPASPGLVGNFHALKTNISHTFTKNSDALRSYSQKRL